MKQPTNQKEALLYYLQEGHEVDFLVAANVLGISQLTARVAELRREGWSLQKRTTKGRNRYGNTFSKVFYSNPVSYLGNAPSNAIYYNARKP